MIAVWIVAAVVLVGLAAYWLLMSPSSQLFGRYPYRARTAERVVALTFDDGPNEPYTSEIADYLSSMDIRATFFQVGRCIERHPDVTAKLQAAGHVVGNHSFSHTFGTYFVPGAMTQEVERTQRLLSERLGRTPLLYRSPWLFRQPMLLRMLAGHRLQPVSGTFCHPLEVFQPNGERLARRAIARTRPGSILIFHDGFDGRGGDRSETVRAVRLTTEELLRRGYRFVTIDEMLATAAYSPQ